MPVLVSLTETHSHMCRRVIEGHLLQRYCGKKKKKKTTENNQMSISKMVEYSATDSCFGIVHSHENKEAGPSTKLDKSPRLTVA